MSHALPAALDALYLVLWVSLPVLLGAALVSALMGLLQSATKLGEPALAAIPRVLVVWLVLGMSAPWMAGRITELASRLLRALPEWVR